MRMEAEGEMGFWDEAEVIHRYSREQAIEDGYLLDVSEIAREAGFKIPVALTASVWADVNNIPPGRRGVGDPEGRLWDLLLMGRIAINKANGPTPEVTYGLIMPIWRRRNYYAKIHIGLGDHGEPVVTVLRPEED